MEFFYHTPYKVDREYFTINRNEGSTPAPVDISQFKVKLIKHPRVTIYARLDETTGRIRFSTSRCSANDNFSRVIGRHNAKINFIDEKFVHTATLTPEEILKPGNTFCRIAKEIAPTILKRL